MLLSAFLWQIVAKNARLWDMNLSTSVFFLLSQTCTPNLMFWKHFMVAKRTDCPAKLFEVLTRQMHFLRKYLVLLQYEVDMIRAAN